MIVKVKIIRRRDFDDLEPAINTWLEEFHSLDVIDIKFTEYMFDWGYNDTCKYYIAIIIYCS